MTDKMKIIEYVLENNTKEDSDWKCYSNAGSYDGNDVDERWVRIIVHPELDTDSGAHFNEFQIKECVRLVRYGNMLPPLVNVQYTLFTKDGERPWELVTENSNGTMPYRTAKQKYLGR